MRESQVRVGRAAVLFGIFLALAASPAWSCSSDADCDNRDTCSIPDQCVGLVCVLGGGGDTNGNLICDAEDPPGELDVVKIIVKKTLARSRIAITGFFIDDSPSAAFTGTDGVSVRVRDHLADNPPEGVDVTGTFPPAECVTTTTAVQCTEKSTKSRASFVQQSRAPGQYAFVVKFGGLELSPPFFNPVQVILTYGTNKHRKSQSVTDCKLYYWGIKCREP